MQINYDRKKNEINNADKNIRFYSVVIALLPILSVYSSGVPGINLGELILIVFLGYSIIFKKKYISNNHNKATIIVVFAWYIIVFTMVGILYNSTQINDVIVRTVRFTFHLFVIYYLSKKFFSVEIASKLIRNVSILATVYIFIQNVCYKVFGIILKGFLPFFPLYTSMYETYDYAGLYEMIFYRPTSFFLEPAHYSQYVLLGIVIFLFKEKFCTKNIFFALFLTFGILLSTSGQGLVIAFCIWFIYAIYLLFSRGQLKKKRLLGLFFPVISILVLPFLLKREVVQNNLSRIFSDSSNTAVSARTQGYRVFILEDNLYLKIFGSGFGNTPEGVWFSSLSYIMYCSGIVGLLILVLIFMKYFLKVDNKYTKMLILLSFALSASAEIIHSYWIITMFSLFIYSNEINKNSGRDIKSPYFLGGGV